MKKFLLFNVIVILVIFSVLTLILTGVFGGGERPVDHITIRFSNGLETNEHFREMRVPLYARGDGLPPATRASTLGLPDGMLAFDAEHRPRGHDFTDWIDRGTGEPITHVPGGLTRAEHDDALIFFAEWDPATFTFVFDTRTTLISNPVQMQVEFGSIVQGLPYFENNPRPNHTFEGWWTGTGGAAGWGERVRNGERFEIDNQERRLRLNARWEPTDGAISQNFTINFNLTLPAYQVTIPGGSTMLVTSANLHSMLPTPSHGQNDFMGWQFRDQWGSPHPVSTPSDLVTRGFLQPNQTSIWLFANWIPNSNFSFTLTFTSNRTGVGNPPSITVTNNSNMNQALPAMQHATGIHLGWESSNGQVRDVATLGDVVNRVWQTGQTTATVRGVWRSAFTITFNRGTGTGIQGAATLTVNTIGQFQDNFVTNLGRIGIPASGQQFRGWYNGTQRFTFVWEVSDRLAATATAFTLTAQYDPTGTTTPPVVNPPPGTQNPPVNPPGQATFTVSLSDRGTIIQTFQQTSGQQLAVERINWTAPTRQGWQFRGFRDAGTNVLIFREDGFRNIGVLHLSSNVTFHADWIQVISVITLRCSATNVNVWSFDHTDGQVLRQTVVTAPSRGATWRFDGWERSGVLKFDGNGQRVWNSAFSGSATFTARWTQITPPPANNQTFTITLMCIVNGIVDSWQHTSGTQLRQTAPVPQRAGRTFGGWRASNGTLIFNAQGQRLVGILNISGNITLNAVW